METKEIKCSCGIAASSLFQRFTELRQELKNDQPDLFRVLDIARDDLPYGPIVHVERDCNVNLDATKKLLKQAVEDIIGKNWGEVKTLVQNADYEAWKALLKCSEREV
jgi:hypothetical protein